MSAVTGAHARLLLARGAPRGEAVRAGRPSLPTPGQLLAADEDLAADLAGYGPDLARFVCDEAVTDVLVNEPDRVWVDAGSGLLAHPIDLGGPDGVRRLAQRLAAAAGRRLDDACPIVDGTLPDGTRLHAVLPPLSATCTLISLRTRRRTRLGIDDLAAAGTLAPAFVDVLRAGLARHASMFISGATGAGKTTLLGALLAEVDPAERIVCIEEVTELAPDHPHVVHLQERRANVQDVGTVTMTDLLRAAMRMRPDRLVLGECRGPEVREVLTAMNTGHEGGFATIHANAASQVPARLVALAALADMGPDTVAAQVAAGLDLIVHIRRARPGERPGRIVTEVAVPCVNAGRLVAEPALVARGRGVDTGPAWEALADRLEIAAVAGAHL